MAMEDNGNVPGGSGTGEEPFVIRDEFSSILPPKKSYDWLKNCLMVAGLVASLLLLFYILFSVYILNDLARRAIVHEENITLSENWLNSLSADAWTLRGEDRITHEEYKLIMSRLQEFNDSVVGIRVFNNALISLLVRMKINNGLNILYCRFMADTVENNLLTLLKNESQLDKILDELKKREFKKQEVFFSLNEKIVSINKYYLVISYSPQSESMLKHGKFTPSIKTIKTIYKPNKNTLALAHLISIIISPDKL